MAGAIGQKTKRGGSRSVADDGVRLLVAALAAILYLFHAAPANATGKYAAMVIDANTGNVVSAHAADEPRYPASLTKMMTLYVVFDLIEQGRLSYNTKIRVSPEAAATAPSKLGLEPGSEIALIDAMKALITKSANDMAVALAEHVAGSERKFAALMTQKARHIGMASTTFKNAHGLPDPEQVTTARDMVTLGLRLQDDFPKHYPLFATREFRFAGDTHRNHNTLLFHYDGTDGIKTGYTQSSGFNLVANVRRGQKHVMGVVFGGASAAARNQNMRTLLNIALLKGSTAKTRQPSLIARARKAPAPKLAARPEAVAAAQMPVPAPQPASRPAPTAVPVASDPDPWAGKVEVARVRPILVAPRQPRQAQLPSQPAQSAAEPPVPTPVAYAPAPPAQPPQAVRTSAPLLAPAAIAPPPSPARGAPPSTLQAQAKNLARGTDSVAPPALRTQVADNATTPAYRLAGPAATPAGAVQIQIGAYNSASEAEKRIASARQQAGDLLGANPAAAVAVHVAGKQMYRARFSGFDAARAGQVCTELRRRLIDCLVAKSD